MNTTPFNPADYGYIFIKTENEHNRIKNILLAIEYGDADLYWGDKQTWGEKHGKFFRANELKPKKKKKKTKQEQQQKKVLKHYKSFRDCFGKHDKNHNFCIDTCGIRKQCNNETKRSTKT